MGYTLLIISIVFAVSNNLLLHKYGGKNDSKSAFLFNAMISAVWLVILFSIRNVNFCPNKEVLLFGMIYGVVQTSFLYFKMQALITGPVAVTTLIGTCSFILSTIVGIIAWKEEINLIQIVGLLLIIASIFMCTEKSKEKNTTSLRWKLYCLGFFIAAALVGIIFKAFSKCSDGDAGDMMAVSSVVMLISFLIMSGCIKDKKIFKSFDKRDILYAVLCGTVSCVYLRLNIFLAGVFPSIVFFPVFNGSLILLALVFAVILFKEKLTRIQWGGFASGLLGIILVSGIITL